jgi:hypothetical protein
MKLSGMINGQITLSLKKLKEHQKGASRMREKETEKKLG